MTTKIITLTAGTILIVSVIASFFMEMITKEVLAGAMITIILPFLMFIAYLDVKSKHAKKKNAKAIGEDELVFSGEEEEISTPMPAFRKTASKEIERVHLFV